MWQPNKMNTNCCEQQLAVMLGKTGSKQPRYSSVYLLQFIPDGTAYCSSSQLSTTLAQNSANSNLSIYHIRPSSCMHSFTLPVFIFYCNITQRPRHLVSLSAHNKHNAMCFGCFAHIHFYKYKILFIIIFDNK